MVIVKTENGKPVFSKIVRGKMRISILFLLEKFNEPDESEVLYVQPSTTDWLLTRYYRGAEVPSIYGRPLTEYVIERPCDMSKEPGVIVYFLDGEKEYKWVVNDRCWRLEENA